MTRGRHWRRRSLTRRAITWVLNVVIIGVALGPILWGFSTSVKPTQSILRYPPQLIPDAPTFEHYRFLFETGIGRPILNSAIVSAGSVLLCLAVGCVAAYALARIRFRGRAFLLFSTMALMSIPLPSLLVPTFTLLANVGMTNSLLGLTLLYTAYQLPIVVWIMYGFILSLPVELENAAMIDGYGRWQILRKIVLPLSGPGLVASALFVLTFAWNDFVVAVAMNSSEATRTLPVAIYGYLGFFGRDWGPLTAAAMVSIVPVILVFVIFQRFFLSGMTSGGVKN